MKGTTTCSREERNNAESTTLGDWVTIRSISDLQYFRTAPGVRERDTLEHRETESSSWWNLHHYNKKRATARKNFFGYALVRPVATLGNGATTNNVNGLCVLTWRRHRNARHEHRNVPLQWHPRPREADSVQVTQKSSEDTVDWEARNYTNRFRRKYAVSIFTMTQSVVLRIAQVRGNAGRCRRSFC